jgi:hypothetical protein
MKFIKTVLVVSIVGILSTGCSSFNSSLQRSIADLTNENTLVKCYSGGQLLLEAESQGKPISEQDSDGYYFFTTDNKFVEVNADCIFTYK